MTSTMSEVPRPSPLRIGVGSGVIAAHVALLLMSSLAAPEGYELRERMASKPLDIDIIVRTPVPPVPPPPMPVAPPRARTPVKPQPAPVPVPVVPTESAFVIEAPAPAEAVVEESASPGAAEGEADAAPATTGFAGLTLLHAPEPPYPARAKRMGWQGEVVLRIHVGADGHPREVRIVHSSGHAELDRSARAHVLRHWRFAPPQREAVGEVPIRFALL